MRSQRGMPRSDEGRNAWPTTAVAQQLATGCSGIVGHRWCLAWVS